MACTPTSNAASCDFTIMVEGTEFKSHREILSSTSNYFDALFRSNMRETKEGRVELQGMTSETFAVVLNFIHQRVHGLTTDNIDDIWDAANRLDIGIYLKEIEHFVIDNLSIDNLWHFYLKSVDFNSIQVKEGSLTFMKQNYELVLRMKEFLNFPFPLVLSCIESEELNVKTEDSVLESILVWVSHGEYRPSACISPNTSDKGAACKDVKLQISEGHSRHVTITGQSGSVIKFGQNCDTGTVAQAGQTATDKPDINFRKHGQNVDVKDEEHTGVGTKCSRTGDRASYLAKLMSSAKITLATESYLQSLLKNPYIIQCPDAYNGVQEALKYKCGVYPLESAILAPLRKCSERKNAMALLGLNSGLHLYDLETRTFSEIKLEKVKRSYRFFLSFVSLGSRLAFLCTDDYRNCSFARHTCPLYTVFLLDENKNVSTLYELCGQYTSVNALLRVNNKIICFQEKSYSVATRCRIANPDLLNTVTLDYGIDFIPVCVFENDILMVNHKDFFNDRTDGFPVYFYNLKKKSLTSTLLLNVGDQCADPVAIHKDGDTFLLLSSGVLLSVKRGSDNAVQLTPVVRLWTFEWWLSGAVCYKNELTLFSALNPIAFGNILTSVPGLFDKIKFVELGMKFKIKNMVPVVAPVSWFG
ncbi:uncharacterized protein LOC131944306 isoform X1 [Physella acuta]|uniref:uncharacterized protein LOC131944306 isoform X1 n=1 Tax=Physella acuta TaxID=109671 RepID=UPI0027DC8A1B|nr:uncharacterized protein LOC131944306 isoform X1 [Physella acuta]XP_059160843.1 uncharacterized protein LOC131944306 isoform X1 [Physella acuta]